MADPTTDADRIRAAIQRCIDASPAPPTTDDIAAAVLMEAAAVLFPEEPHPTELQRSTTAKGTAIDRAIDEAWDTSAWLNRKRANKILQALAQQLNGATTGMPPMLEPTPPCCEAWISWAAEAAWHALDDDPSILVMPHAAGTRHRFNFCPSCGAERRSAVMKDPTA